MDDVWLNLLCAPLIAYINRPKKNKKKRQRDRRERHKDNTKNHIERVNIELREGERDRVIEKQEIRRTAAIID
jgi:hypothetical protein